MLKLAVRVVGGTLLARAVAKHATRKIARGIAAVEREAETACDAVNAEEGDPHNALDEHSEERYAGRQGPKPPRGRFVSALVALARAEFGPPFGPEFSDPVVRRATEIKVHTYLVKVCRERHVRVRDIAYLVPEAVALYFVPTRRDIRIQHIKSSAAVAELRRGYVRAGNSIVSGAVRGFLRVLGHNVGGRTIDTTAPEILGA